MVKRHSNLNTSSPWRKSFVASSFSKSNSVNQESLGMIENDHIWGASGASGESNIDGEINSNSISKATH